VTSDPLKVLLRYHHWATARLLEHADKLSSVQFHQRFAIGRGSVHDTLIHVVECVFIWVDFMRGESRARLEGRVYTVLEISKHLDRSIAEMEEWLSKPLTDIVRVDFDGTIVPFTRAVAIMQPLVHGTHHRAQCLNMLKQLGIAPLPEIDLIDWQFECEKP